MAGETTTEYIIKLINIAMRKEVDSYWLARAIEAYYEYLAQDETLKMCFAYAKQELNEGICLKEG